MSEQLHDHEITDTHVVTDVDGAGTPPVEVTVRRNAGLAGAIGGVAAVVAILYLSRASGSGAWLDWALCLGMGAVAAAWLQAFVDARTPLLVADAHGLRVRQGRAWHGMPWDAVEALEHLPRTSVLRDGRLEVFPVEGEPLSVPLSLSTRVAGAGDDLTAALDALAAGAAEVVEVYDDYSAESEVESEVESEIEPETGIEAEPAVAAAEAPELVPDETEERAEERRLPDPRPWLAGAINGLARLRRTPGEGVPEDQVIADEHVAALAETTPTPAPLRDPLTAARIEVRSDLTTDPDELEQTAVRELRRPGRVDLVEEAVPEVEAASVTAVAPLRIDDLEAPEAAPDPVIGPQLAAARERLRLSVDQLAERTRIRPHVIESIEVDDFAPCGGDFYARGHLRTLARIVGIDVAPLLATYEERYADAPVDPRRVFEAELATGSSGGIRGTRGGPSWSVLVAAVMVLVLAWSVARLFMDGPVALDKEPPLDGSAGLSSSATGSVTSLRLDAAGGGAAVKVVDGEGQLVFTGDLAFGQVKTLKKVVTPIKVTSSDGSLVVTVGDGDAKAIGETGERASQTYVVRR
ncbi:MAG TPA: helix-turn-helix transcriptional regulator [Nocardioides sp.]|uniref:helix-turn-helix domain-containing protein n=1 Tax=Nocardioides sp. TaxID=35761 RepID=UPI002CF697DC|nr:helix-turn-helix transcriptional regulator [Nocardioides sp.]HTW16572.1 helix-turn-helix transcriptional regulator [Nocardioides sp.]